MSFRAVPSCQEQATIEDNNLKRLRLLQSGISARFRYKTSLVGNPETLAIVALDDSGRKPSSAANRLVRIYLVMTL